MSTTTTATHEDQVAAVFAAGVAGHQMTVLRDDGLYRHLRFQAPDTGLGYFDLVTWPRHLAVVGDMDGYVFTRMQDMFAFFRMGWGRINPSYWSKKLTAPAGPRAARTYSEDILLALLEPWLADHDAVYAAQLKTYEAAKLRYDTLPAEVQRFEATPSPPWSARELIAQYTDVGELQHEANARGLLSELEDKGVVPETWEWDLTDWDWHFLRACHAIVWGIAKYDATRSASEPEKIAAEEPEKAVRGAR